MNQTNINNNQTNVVVSHEKSQKQFKVGQFFLYILLLIFALMVILPLIWTVLVSFKTKDEVANHPSYSLPAHFYWANYAHAWVDAKMGTYLFNTVFITVISLLVLVLVSVPCAYVLGRFNFKGKKILETLILSGIFINVNYIVIPIYTMTSFVTNSLNLYGFANSSTMVIIIYVATSIAFSVYLMEGFFVSLSPSFEEAAMLDGCGYFRMLLVIIAPLAMPSILIVLLFNFLKFWNEYLVANTFLIDESQFTLSKGLLTLMHQDRAGNDTGRLFAGLTIVMIPTIIFYVAVQDQLTKGLTIGGGKE